MEYASLESKLQRNSPVEFRYIKTAGLAGLVCGANIRPNLLESGGSCYEAEKPRSDSWNHRRSLRGEDVNLAQSTVEPTLGFSVGLFVPYICP